MLQYTEGRFEVGDFVFAKLKGHPHWPATISQIETIYANGVSGQERTRYNVYFYGSHQMSMVKVDSIVNFEENYEPFKRKYANNLKFISALKELENDLETRKDYLKSLQECLVESTSITDKPEDEMFSVCEASSDETDDAYGVCSPTTSSGFGDSFDSDEEYQILYNQKYEICSIDKVVFPGTTDSLLVVSLAFNEKDLQEDFDAIKNEIRMMSCFVKLERLPANVEKVFTESEVKAPAFASPPVLNVPDERECENWIVKKRKKKKKKWRRNKGQWNSNTKPSLTILAAEAVKRRRRQRRTVFRDETRLNSLRQRNVSVAPVESTNNCSCSFDICNCIKTEVEESSYIVCPICQAQFSSSVDFKQHSFNIHIMGL